LVASHLRPGGIVGQWLPLYEMTTANIRSVVGTFQENFPYTMLWMTHSDAEIVGSNAPIVIDEADLAKRIAPSAIAKDLHRVTMGSASDFLSYFVMGTGEMKEFARGAVINTDDNLYLEFSTPYAIRDSSARAENITAIARYREGLLPYLVPSRGAAARSEQVKKWTANMFVAKIMDQALALFHWGRYDLPLFKKYLTDFDVKYPWFAPGRFLINEYMTKIAPNPKLLDASVLFFVNDQDVQVRRELAVVLLPISRERASVVVMDKSIGAIYGQRYLSGHNLDEQILRFKEDMLASIETVYRQEAQVAHDNRTGFPSLKSTMDRIRLVIEEKVRGN
jgi:spermidine synthase